MLALTILLTLVALLAFANGANDNCKGVATLVGYGAATPRSALVWAAVSTAIGSAISFWAAAGLIKSFSGGGLFASGAALSTPFFTAVLLGAWGWILFATFMGLPVSTTHAITGALCGAGMTSFGTATVHWAVAGQRVAVPLALSPLMSLAVVYALAWPVAMITGRFAARCLCVAEAQPVLVGGGADVAPMPVLVSGKSGDCAAVDAVGVSGSSVANATHWLTAGLVGFARGWNDAPKIAALSIGALASAGIASGAAIAFAIVTVAMAAGGLLAGRRVLETLSKKVTTMPLPESLTASLVTASLVSLASWHALPVSTTHVSTGAIIGVGLKHDPRGVRWGTVGQIVLSWVVTLPVAALIAAAAASIIQVAAK
jgi:PiT family inorganic phosphate transporter